MPRIVPTRVSLLLFFVFFLGLMLSVLAFVDLHWTHWLLIRDDKEPPGEEAPAGPVGATQSFLNLFRDSPGRSGHERAA